MDLVVSLLLGLDRPITSPQVISFYHLVITIIVNNYKGSHSINSKAALVRWRCQWVTFGPRTVGMKKCSPMLDCQLASCLRCLVMCIWYLA